jgi:hypothetical protein
MAGNDKVQLGHGAKTQLEGDKDRSTSSCILASVLFKFCPSMNFMSPKMLVQYAEGGEAMGTCSRIVALTEQDYTTAMAFMTNETLS